MTYGQERIISSFACARHKPGGDAPKGRIGRTCIGTHQRVLVAALESLGGNGSLTRHVA